MREIIGSFLEFPGVVITVSLILAVLRRKKIYLIVAALFYVLSAPVFWVKVQELWGLDQKPAKTWIVVLGGGLISSGEEWELSRATLKRLERGFELWKDMKVPVVLSGGGKFDVPEAVIMAKVMRSWGVPERYIKIEPDSNNTWESAVNVRSMLSTSTINLVTSQTHTRRAVYAFRRQGFDVRSISCDRILSVRPSVEWFLPRSSTLEFLSELTHEIIGLIYYHVFGGMSGG